MDSSKSEFRLGVFSVFVVMTVSFLLNVLAFLSLTSPASSSEAEVTPVPQSDIVTAPETVGEDTSDTENAVVIDREYYILFMPDTSDAGGPESMELFGLITNGWGVDSAKLDFKGGSYISLSRKTHGVKREGKIVFQPDLTSITNEAALGISRLMKDGWVVDGYRVDGDGGGYIALSLETLVRLETME